MTKSILFTALMVNSLMLCGQNLKMTFTANGASAVVDSVKATNLSNNESITLPGYDTLILSYNTSGISHTSINQLLTVYPNPFMGKTQIVANFLKAQTISLQVFNLTGQSVVRTQAIVQSGSNYFDLNLAKAGVYIISLYSEQYTESIKVLCSESSGNENQIKYCGPSQSSGNAKLKTMNIYTLSYTDGDIILYRCRGGVHTTIITDSPVSSTNYEVGFAPCIDPDGKSYAIVKIGTQTWMAENLAWLPSVSVSSKGSDTLKYYYVYETEDSVVSRAKNAENYKKYGVLYNWPAAINMSSEKLLTTPMMQGGCPTGWHLPDDDEWKMLEMTLGMDQADTDSLYWRNSGEVGHKLKSSVNWSGNGNGSNQSGFSSLPGGYRNTHGGFQSLNEYAVFWTSSQSDNMLWYRSIYFENKGVYRIKTMPGHGFSVRCVKDGL